MTTANIAREPNNVRRINMPLLAIVTGFCAALLYDPSLFEVMFAAIADAYLQVSTFVAGTLLLFFLAERAFKFDLTTALAESGKWQVPLAAALGALPGCGGAIIVVTKYVSGRLSFGSVLATLTATMGDAAFLLLAKEPLTGFFIIGLGFAVGVVTGYIVDAIHGRDFMRPKNTDIVRHPDLSDPEHEDFSNQLLDRIWMIIFLPGLVLGLMLAFQIDVDAMLGTENISAPASLLGFIGGMLCFGMWALPRLIPSLRRSPATAEAAEGDSIIRRTIADTNFVTSWVIFAFLLFEVTIHLTNLDLNALFGSVVAFAPLIAVIIGFVPGCGAQILVTTLYLSGYLPLSAQIGNAISNDGDALFPAIALAPGAAIMATLYSAIPALLISYGWFFLAQS
ncbi:MAG: putative manganese transporter [Candidatus Puniceispirillaceae bacterium]